VNVVERSLEEIIEVLKLAADKTRLTILLLLQEKELCVCDLVEMIGISQPGISQHLRKMKQAGLVQERRQGTWMYYRLDESAHPVIQAILQHAPSLKEKLDVYEKQRNPMVCDT
jgi:ArsR family transcriptional regulator